MPRPCPFVSCRYHLGNDAHVGIYERRPVVLRLHEHPDEMSETCALDVADRVAPRALSLEQVATLTGSSIATTTSALVTAFARQHIQHDEDEVA